MFSEWLYTEKLQVLQLMEGDETTRDEINDAEEDLALAETWILAEKFDIPQLQNLVITTMYKIEYVCDAFPLSALSYIYGNTASGSVLRSLCWLKLH